MGIFNFSKRSSAPSKPDAESRGVLDLLRSWGRKHYDLEEDDDPELRAWSCDGESLAEAGVVKWIDEIWSYLAACGAERPNLEEELEDGYLVRIDGAPHAIVLERAPWLAASVFGVRLANELLARAGSEERGYLLYAGANDGLAVFMTLADHARLLAEPLLDPNDRPLEVGTLAAPVD